MNVQPVLIFCCLSALGAAQSVVIIRFIRLEGQVFREQFDFPNVAPQTRKYLCRNECRREDVLMETEGNRLESGRFILRYDPSQGKIHVVIAELRRSDAGRYRVGVGSPSSSLGSFHQFEISVRDLCDGGVVFAEPRVYSATEGGEITVRCSLPLQPLNRKFLCRDECKKFIFDTNDRTATSGRYHIEFGNQSFFNVTIGQLSGSDSGSYRCGVGRQGEVNTCRQFEITVTGGSTLPLVVGCVSAVVALLVVVLLLVYKWKMRRKSVQYENTGRNTRNVETATYDDCGEGFRQEAAVYEELDVNNREQNLYSTLEV